MISCCGNFYCGTLCTVSGYSFGAESGTGTAKTEAPPAWRHEDPFLSRPLPLFIPFHKHIHQSASRHNASLTSQPTHIAVPASTPCFTTYAFLSRAFPSPQESHPISSQNNLLIITIIILITSLPMTDFPQTKQTSTRVRDNQRRSRARKKEYLQDLERRVRQAEQQGVQASAAIQAAARQVAEENQKLRQLLRHHGVNDRHIATYLSSGVVVPPGDSRVQPGGAGCADAIHSTTSPGTPPGLHSSIVPPRRVPTRSCASSPPQSTDENNCSMAADLYANTPVF